MSNTIISPNMNLPVPVPTVDPGPDYANNEVSCFNTIDSHNHTPGNGVQITPAGLNINSNLPLLGNSLTSVGTIQLNPQSSVSTTATVYEQGVDLYYNDGNGNPVRITQGGSVAVSGAIGFTGLPSGTASASYQSVPGTFQFQSATNIPSNISGASISVAQQTVSPNTITIQSPNSLASSYAFTLPTSTPSTTSLLQMDSSGAVSTNSAILTSLVPAGSIISFAGSSAPTGWLICNGASLSTATYASLFAIIGYVYGGSGANFNLPNLAGNVPIGPGGSIGASVGASGGSSTHTLTTAEMPSHNHSASVNIYQDSISGSNSPYAAINTTTGSTQATVTIGNTGGGNPHSIVQPYLCLNFIIKY